LKIVIYIFNTESIKETSLIHALCGTSQECNLGYSCIKVLAANNLITTTTYWASSHSPGDHSS